MGPDLSEFKMAYESNLGSMKKVRPLISDAPEPASAMLRNIHWRAFEDGWADATRFEPAARRNMPLELDFKFGDAWLAGYRDGRRAGEMTRESLLRALAPSFGLQK